MMNKRLLSLALILVLCLTLLAGCGGGSTEDASQESGEPLHRRKRRQNPQKRRIR